MEDISVIRTLSHPDGGAVKSLTVPLSVSKPVRSDSKAAGLSGSGGVGASGNAQRQTGGSPADVEAAVDELNAQLTVTNRALRFHIDEATEDIKVQVIDKDTGKVVRTIPPEASLRLAANGGLSSLFSTQG